MDSNKPAIHQALEVWKGNIVPMDVDAIVNAANSSLWVKAVWTEPFTVRQVQN